MPQIDILLIVTIFTGGLLSFFSPCIIPIIPGYIGYFTGFSIEEIKQGKAYRLKALINSLAFVLGFAVTFSLIGATIGFIGAITNARVDIIRRVGGIAVFILGLHQAGIIDIKLLNFNKGIKTKGKFGDTLSSFMMGIAFSIGWAPCTGPILGGIVLTAIAVTDSAIMGVLLLLVYSIGLGIPFIITALSINFLINRLAIIYKYFGIIKVIGGVILMIMGVLIFTNNITYIALRLS